VDQPKGADTTPPKKAQVGTDKTDKSPLRALNPPFVSSVSSSPGRFRGGEKKPLALHEGAQITKNAPLSRTDKTDKRSEQTLWEEPDIPDKSPPARHVVLLAVPDGVPEEWVQGVADLLVMPPHPAWKKDDWHTLQDDALRFLREWADQAHRLGWATADLFGAHLTKPRVRFDCAGLVVLLQGRPVVVITEDSAAIKTASGGLLTFRRHESSPTERCLIWELAWPEREVA
jgi:hypothetical protein